MTLYNWVLGFYLLPLSRSHLFVSIHTDTRFKFKDGAFLSENTTIASITHIAIMLSELVSTLKKNNSLCTLRDPNHCPLCPFRVTTTSPHHKVVRVKKKMLEMRQVATVQLFPALFCHPLVFFSSLELAVFSRAIHHLIFLWLQTLKKFSLIFPNHFFFFFTLGMLMSGELKAQPKEG